MDIIFGASVLASFLAGMVALFAPCCITVLLPAYLAAVFRERKKILKMTLIFFFGVAVVLVPIGLGVAFLAEVLQNFHESLWIFGGLFMVVLAILSVMGKGLAVPLPVRMKTSLQNKSQNHNKSVFFLGVLSGAATSCCAPVLAGAMTLALLSGVFWKALIVTFSYTFGMVFPLFIGAYFYDKYKIESSKFIKGKSFVFNFRQKTFRFHSTNLIAGSVFLLIGGTMTSLGLSGDAYFAPKHQVLIGEELNKWSNSLFSFLGGYSDIFWGLVVLGFFVWFLFLVFKENKQKEISKLEIDKSDDQSTHSCH